MKVIYSLFLTLLSLFLVGCGSTSSQGIDSTANVTLSYKSLSSDTTSGTLVVEVSSVQSDDMQVIIRDINLSSNQYNIEVTSISQNEIVFNQSGTIEITIKFNYQDNGTRDISKNDLTISYTEVKVSKLTNSQVVNEKVIPLSTLLDNGTDATNTTTDTTSIISDYHIMTSITDFTITQPLESKTIDAYVIDGNKRPISDVSLLVEFFDPKRGKMNSYKGITDANGHVAFTYTAPDNITVLNGQTLEIRLYLEQNSLIAQKVNVQFGITNERKDFYLSSDNNVTVAQSGSSTAIHVTLSYKDENNITHPAVGETIIADFLQPMYGKLESYKAVTDESGIATFTYTSPDRLQYVDGNETNLTFYWEQNVSVTSATRLIFNAQTDGQVAKLYVVPSELIVTEPNQKQTLQIITVNANNVGISTNVQIEQLANGDGVDYGVFDRTTVTTDASGRAEITYTAPSALPNAERNITFTELSQNISTDFILRFQNATESNATTYDINVSTENALEVDSEGRITITIHEVNNPNNRISPDYVYDVNLSSRFVNLLDFNGTASYDYNGTSVKVVGVKTKTLSGVALLDIRASIFDGEKNTTISKTVPIVILSGPVTAISLVYVGVDFNPDKGLFEERWMIHAVDKYANPAREGLPLYPTLISDHKIVVVGRDYNNYLGEIRKTVPTQFYDASKDFTSVDPVTDRLIIMPYASDTTERSDKSYLGDWTISNLIDQNTLELNESYYGETTDKLRYVIGDEKRIIRDTITVADIKSMDPSGTYKTDVNGNIPFVITYDPLLVGHTFALSAKAYDDNNGYRSGTAIRTAFKGLGFTSSKVTVKNDGNTHNSEKMTIWINKTNNYLVGIEVSQDFSSSSVECSVVNGNFKTDYNGNIYIDIQTTGDNNDTVPECTIEWVGVPLYEY
jgi:hypothetical protein